MQGFANGWAIDRGCTRVAFTYGLQKLANAGYAISALAILALLLGLALTSRRRRGGRGSSEPPSPLPAAPAPRPLPVAGAIAVALPLAALAGVAFGLRAGAVVGPVLALVLWRGTGDRVLAWAAALLLVVAVPVAYLVAGLGDDGDLKGNATRFAGDRIAAHWLTLAGLLLVALLVWRTLAAARQQKEIPIDERSAAR
jgi:hypothetical protein